MRLIDADTLFKFLKGQREKETGAYSKGRNNGINIAIGAIRNEQICPTVNAVVLPCKIGDDVYIIPSKEAFDWSMLTGHTENIKVYHQYVVCVTFTERGWHLVANADKAYGTGKVLVDSCYKETWFLTREEAEAALAKMDGGENNV